MQNLDENSLDCAPSKPDLAEQRQEFRGLSNKVYFNFGGQGTLPKAGLEAIIDTYNFLQQKGPFSGQVNDWITKKTELLRQEMAQELGISPSNLSITEDVTVGCNIALWGVDWQAGEHILLTDCEHPGIIATVREIARRYHLEISTCPIRETLNGGNPIEVISAHLRPKTRVLVVSHVLWNTGQVLPLKEISQLCHDNSVTEKPVLVVVDAAQSVGCLPLDLSATAADCYAFTGHKWWCGPAGVGGLYIRPEIFPSLRPTFIGWRGIETDNRGQPIGWKPDARRFEVATSAYPQFEGLRATIAVHNAWGDGGQRYEKICQLAAYLWEELKTIKGVKCLKNSPPESGLVSFQIDSAITPQKLVQQLEKQGFLLRTLLDPLCVRACVHYFTLPSEIEQLVAAIKKLV